MTLYQLKTFVTVARLGSFTLAAETLQVRQPSVSLIVQSLQRELDVRLFDRLGNKIRLTTAGETMLREAEEVVNRAEGIKEKMEEVKGLRKGRISVGGSALAGVSFLPVAVQSFKNENPGIEVRLTIKASTVLENMLIAGDLDVAVMGKNPGSPLLVAELYKEEEVVAIAPLKHPLVKKRSVPLSSIAKEPIISQEKGNIIRQMVEERFHTENLSFLPMLEVDVRGGGRDTIKNAVASGLGIGFIGKIYVLSDLKAGRIRLLNIPDFHLRRPINVVVHKNRQHSSLIQAFTDFITRYKRLF